MREDISHRAMNKAAGRIQGALDKVAALFPYGPTGVQMSQGELEDRLMKLPPPQLLKVGEAMGLSPEKIMELARRGQANGNTAVSSVGG